MAEFETVVIHNPTSEDFIQKYNGEPYTIKKDESNPFVKAVAFHIAYHLSGSILQKENPKSIKKDMRPEEVRKEEIKFSQLLVYDNPRRRIALYRILKSAPLVFECLSRYNLKSFLGEMNEYRDYVIKQEGKFEEKADDGKETIESLTEKVRALGELLSKKDSSEKKEETTKASNKVEKTN